MLDDLLCQLSIQAEVRILLGVYSPAQLVTIVSIEYRLVKWTVPVDEYDRVFCHFLLLIQMINIERQCLIVILNKVEPVFCVELE